MTEEKNREVFDMMKAFVDFGEKDAQNLVSLQPFVAQYGPGITDKFYEILGQYAETLKFIEGRVDALKKTHQAWLGTLVGGTYDTAYFESRWKIGLTHVRIGLPPYWVEAVMTIIRTEMLAGCAKEIADGAELAARYGSFVKICDLDLLIINLSYGEDRLERLADFTGMNRKLIENIIIMPKR